MIFDDRLETVLRNKPAAGEAGFIQYLQLIDLIGRRRAEGPIPDEALDRLTELEELLPPDDRGLILQSSAPVLRHAELVLRLASQAPSIAAAALAASRLGDADWAALIPGLPAHARELLRQRADLGPLAQETLARFAGEDSSVANSGESGTEEEPPFPDADLQPTARPSLNDAEGIAAIVRRIEALRRTRGAEASAALASEPAAQTEPVEPLASLNAVSFFADASGTVTGADREAAPMLVGLQLGQRGPAAPARCDRDTVEALGRRGPVRSGRLVIDGAPRIAGTWRIDATPRFDPGSGGFIGYAGLLRRPSNGRATTGPASEEARLQVMQTLHEVRTPIHAIQGFAEFIHQQLFGPVPHLYVGQSAAIAADAARILAAVDEVGQLVADGRNGSDGGGDCCDLAEIARDQAQRLEQGLIAHGVGFRLELQDPAPAALSETVARPLLWRLLAALASLAAPGERLGLKIEEKDEQLALVVDLPERWAGSDAGALISIGAGTATSLVTPSALGSGFALRLAAAEAARAGGSLKFGEDRLELRLPRGATMAHAAEGEAAEEAGSDLANAGQGTLTAALGEGL